MSKQATGCTRRGFIRWGAAGAAGAALAGCGGPLRTTPNERYLKLPAAAKGGAVALGMYGHRRWRRACEQAVSAVDDLSWLSRGDSVFVKVACNSDQVHPAVTSPAAIEALVGLLRDRGAGVVHVGDQAGVEHVRLTATGRVSATRKLMARNGQLAAIRRSGARLHCFDDHGWDGYFAPKLDFEDSWQGTLWLPKILRRVDHVVYLTRLGTHALAGYTCGIKNAVGWLRDDSRLVYHQRGGTFFEKAAEINHAPPLRDKLRLCLTLGDAALLDIGPDFGGEYDFHGCVALAARNLVDHDSVAAALLPWLDDDTWSFYDLHSPYPGHVNFWNRTLVKTTWGAGALDGYKPIVPYNLSQPLAHDASISHLAWLQRYRPKKIEVRRQGRAFPRGLTAHLGKASGGVFAIL